MWNHSVILCPVIHLQGNKKHYWDNKENRALKRKTKFALFILASKYGVETQLVPESEGASKSKI